MGTIVVVTSGKGGVGKTTSHQSHVLIARFAQAARPRVICARRPPGSCPPPRAAREGRSAQSALLLG